jgi:enoyl-CoA hydratase/carnithine racemase
VSENGAGDPDGVVLIRDDGHVRIVTMNRPGKLNALNGALFGGLADAFEAAAADDEARVLVLTGAGRAFTAGADLTDMSRARTSPQGAQQASGDNPFDRLLRAAESFPKPLVAAVNGVGVGLGFTILGYCDFTFVAASARLRTPFTRLGLAPEASSSFLFPLRMGWQNAASALLAGEWFDAQRAVDCGLARQVCADEDVLQTAVAFAAELAAGPLESLMATKGLMLDAYRDIVARTRRRENETLARLVGGAANQAALQAFHSRETGAGKR